jgi:hypothetical protein
LLPFSPEPYPSKNAKFRTYKIIILPVVLYGHEIWSLTLREEHRLTMFENRVLRIVGQKRDEVTGGWRKLQNKELHDLFHPAAGASTVLKPEQYSRTASGTIRKILSKTNDEYLQIFHSLP